MNDVPQSFEAFLALPDRDRQDIFEAAATRLDTLPGYVEKDFWVCLVLDVLYNRMPEGHPRLLFKGGTSLSKVFGLIRRFSEDIDLVVCRDDLGFEGDRDPADGSTLLVEYPALYPGGADAYVAPRVKIEAGARSALVPAVRRDIAPIVADELPDWSFDARDLRVIAPERTYWEKLLILHGLHCGHRDEQRMPTDRDRISRHYYDAAMITASDIGRSALSNIDMLDAVRSHNLIAFRQAWIRFDEAVPGSIRFVPQAELRTAIESDYRAMEGMILGDAPPFERVLEQIDVAEATANRGSR